MSKDFKHLFRRTEESDLVLISSSNSFTSTEVLTEIFFMTGFTFISVIFTFFFLFTLSCLLSHHVCETKRSSQQKRVELPVLLLVLLAVHGLLEDHLRGEGPLRGHTLAEDICAL